MKEIDKLPYKLYRELKRLEPDEWPQLLGRTAIEIPKWLEQHRDKRIEQQQDTDTNTTNTDATETAEEISEEE